MMQPNIGELLQDAALLMLVGMSVVFIFLSGLIAAVNALSWFCGKFKDHEKEPSNLAKRKPVSDQGSLNPSLTAAISAAVHQYRSQEQECK